jgi:hypothetical protein
LRESQRDCGVERKLEADAAAAVFAVESGALVYKGSAVKIGSGIA